MSILPSSEILIATRNAGKAREMANLLHVPNLRLRSLGEFPQVSEVEETGATFAANAKLKARFYAAQTGLVCIADDSGLEVAALNGAPGVLSARFAGRDASDAQRIARLLKEIKMTSDRERRARFVCAVAIAEPQVEEVRIFTGECRGRITDSPRGVGGFGYDPVFIPEGYAQTFAELSPQIKSQISHRARALHAVRAFLCGQAK